MRISDGVVRRFYRPLDQAGGVDVGVYVIALDRNERRALARLRRRHGVRIVVGISGLALLTSPRTVQLSHEFWSLADRDDEWHAQSTDRQEAP